jgi:hypothetical protein
MIAFGLSFDNMIQYNQCRETPYGRQRHLVAAERLFLLGG